MSDADAFNREPTRAKTLACLRGMQDADLIQSHDPLLQTGSYVIESP